ncbi:MAG: hypothetical protein A2X80_00540 [Geobacteraceae bacterium GWB2_52_12]|nr:MAG: hypothetical protein A2X80_00540 [Geobacteraceae bacterium GWB2_52_12]
MEELDDDHDNERRPLPMVLLGGLYLFFLMLTMSTFGHPYPLLGTILQGKAAEVMVLVDSIICLYLFLGLMKRQLLTWYLLLGYNIFEMVNTLVNLRFITVVELEKMVGQPVDPQGLIINNISVLVAIVLLTIFIYRHRQYFSNRSNFLF